MKRVRRILPIFLALVMCVTSILPVYATGDVTTISTEPTGSFSTTNGSVMFEAEDVRINTENDPNAADYAAKNDVVRVEKITGTTTATTASGEGAVRMRLRYNHKVQTIAYADCTPNLTFDIMVDQAGTYYVWARVAVYSASYKSIWLAIDQAENYTNTIPSTEYYNSETPSFVWGKIATIENREKGKSIRVDIKPRHGNSDMGILIDTFVVTADAAFVPTDAQPLPDVDLGNTETKYTVRFIDYNNAELSSAQYVAGAKIEIPSNPSRAEDEDYTYTFAGWKLYNETTGQVEGDFLASDATVTGNATYQAVYAETDVQPVAQVGDNNYASLETAIDAAPASSVIKLLKNVEAESIETEKYFTLDLNGYTLQVSSFGKYVNVVDNSTTKTGLLKVEADECTLPPTNEQMPVYNGTDGGYVFVTIKDQNDGATVSENSFKLIFRPSFGIDAVAKNTLLASGGETAGIRIGLRLYWMEGDVQKSQVLLYGKDADDVDMVATVYSQGKAFYIDATGTNNFTNLKVAPYIESATGVVWNGTPIPVN